MLSTETLAVLRLAAGVVTPLCVAAVLLAVFVDFVEFDRRTQVKAQRRSIVATGTMLAFFTGLYLIIRLQVGVITDISIVWQWLLIPCGCLLLVLGAMVNVAGRMTLGRNWANHVKIYADHTLVTGGAYRFVRHPLYASLIWMSYGSALVYANWAVALATTVIFVPFMYYRARQEEELLAREFPEYVEYRRRVRMFI